MRDAHPHTLDPGQIGRQKKKKNAKKKAKKKTQNGSNFSRGDSSVTENHQRKALKIEINANKLK